MIYSAIKKRTQEVNKQLNQVWCKKWMKYVEHHPEHPWDWSGISQNDLKKEKNTFIEKKYREHLSAFKIQQWFYHIKLNPNYNYCRKRVNMIYDRYLS